MHSNSVRPPPPPPQVVRSKKKLETRARTTVEHDEATILGGPKELLSLCETELASGPSDLRAARLHYEIAWFYETQTKEVSRATEHYLAATERDPESIRSLQGARRCLQALGRFPEAASTLVQEIELTRNACDRARLFYEHGRLLEDNIDAPEDAKQAYLKGLMFEPSNENLLKAVESWQRRFGEWAALEKTYERMDTVLDGDPKHQAALLAERARIAEHDAKDPTRAAELYEAALELNPDVSGAFIALRRLHHASGRWRDLVRLLDREVRVCDLPENRTAIMLEQSRYLEEKLGDLSRAVNSAERARVESPSHLGALRRLTTLYAKLGRHSDLVGILEELTTHRIPEAKTSLPLQIARTYEGPLSDTSKARTWYETALQHNPGLQAATAALSSIYRNSKSWTALIDMESAIVNSDSATVLERARSHASIAGVSEFELNRKDEAIEHHRSAVALFPGFEPSFSALCRLLATSAQFRALIELYEQEIDRSEGSENRISYLFRIGLLYEDRLNDPNAASHCYARVLRIKQDHRGAMQSMARSSASAQDWQTHVKALDLEAAIEEQITRKVRLETRAAEVTYEKLNDVHGALGRLVAIRRAAPKDELVLNLLGTLLYETGRWRDFLEVRGAQRELVEPGQAWVKLSLEMAAASERLVENERALELYLEALTVSPANTEGLRCTTRLLEAKGAFEQLAKVFEQQRSVTTAECGRVELSLQLGRIWEEHLSDKKTA
ncbi:MAG: hypothetical protein AAF550_10635, partial [Myxococcota bacterium]